MTLEELGASLRLEREKRGLHLDDVADHLKISVRLLRALEEGNRAALPHLAYARGFVRSYAAYLGMSADEVGEALLAMSDAGSAQVQPVLVRPRPRREGGALKWFILFLVLVILCGVYAAWEYGWLSSWQQEQRLAQPAPPLSAPNEPDQSADMLSEHKPFGAEPAVEKTPVMLDNAASLVPRTDSSRGEQAQIAASPAILQPSAAPVQREEPAAQGVLPGGQHKVVITAIEECWVHSNADNTDTRQFSLRKGDTFALTFIRTLRLKLGNAGGVRIRYNGQEMPPPGTSGQVRTLIFPPAAP